MNEKWYKIKLSRQGLDILNQHDINPSIDGEGYHIFSQSVLDKVYGSTELNDYCYEFSCIGTGI